MLVRRRKFRLWRGSRCSRDDGSGRSVSECLRDVWVEDTY
jgi:hypothetical protein